MCDWRELASAAFAPLLCWHTTLSWHVQRFRRRHCPLAMQNKQSLNDEGGDEPQIYLLLRHSISSFLVGSTHRSKAMKDGPPKLSATRSI